MTTVADRNNKVIFLTASYKGYPLDIVESLVPAGYQLITMETTSHEEVVKKAEQANYILASGNLKIDEEVLFSAKRLKMIQRVGVGTDSLDIAAIASRNIPVYRNKGVNSNSVAEHAVMFILAALRRLPIINNNVKNGVWKKQEQGVLTRELSTQTVGIIGGGNIGRRVATLLKPFNCNILYYDPYRLPCKQEQELGLEYKDLDTLLALSDIVTLHCPLTNDTRNVICRDNLEKMKDGVILVNTSRGALINEADFLYAINSGKIGFACLDVFNEEPIKQSALIHYDNVMCTPHIAGNTYDSFVKMMGCAFRNIESFEQGNYSAIEEFRLKLD